MKSETYRSSVLIYDFQGRLYAWFSEVPIFSRAVVAEEAHQSRYVDVIVVVKVTEPSATKNANETHTRDLLTIRLVLKKESESCKLKTCKLS